MECDLRSGVGPGVVKIAPNGVQTTVWTDSSTIPSRLAIDPTGNLYVVDSANQRVLQIQPNVPRRQCP